ncbi:MAG: hypothetical protein ABFR75_09950 [Acidobacteriota bacterium]
MLKNFIKIVLILMAGSIGIVAEEGFYLKINLSNREFSKDSNSQTYIVKIENGKFDYKFRYGGFPDNRKEEKSRDLGPEELSKVIKYIRERKINIPVTEVISTKANGPSIKVNLSLFMKLDGEEMETKISGNYSIFRGDGKIKGKIIKNKGYVDSVMSLIRSLKRDKVKRKK